MAGLLVGAGLWLSALLLTSRCPVCGKSLFVKEGLQGGTIGGWLTQTVIPFPERHCSRCRTQID